MKIFDVLTIREINLIKQLGETQSQLLECTGDLSSMIHFKFNESMIVNPFVDKDGFVAVDPIEYYGDIFLNSDFVKTSY
jgi:hypothetical protein